MKKLTMGNRSVVTTTSVLFLVLKIYSAFSFPCPGPLGWPYPEECACTEDGVIGSIVNCTANETTDLYTMFYDLSGAIGNNPIDMLYLQFPGVEQPVYLPTYVMNVYLNFNTICIANILNMADIHPLAFPNLYEYTTNLQFQNVWFDDKYDPFHFIRKFVNLEHVSFEYGKVSKIPSRAFHGMKYLESISFTENQVTEIGVLPFDDLSALSTLSLVDNQLTAQGFSAGAFDGIGQYAFVNLAGNQNLTYLPEEIFKPLLDKTKAQVAVGPPEDNDEDNHLVCDARADWICQNIEEYEPKLIGFYCVGGEFQDVFDYCRSK